MSCQAALKQLLLLCFLGAHTSVTFAQNRKLDSLDNLIHLATSDTAKINLNNKKISIISRINVDSAIVLCEQIIKQCNKIDYPGGEASARLNQVSNFCVKGYYDKAAQYLTQAAQTFSTLNDSLGICKTYAGYGMMYGMQSKYDSSILFLEKAIGIAERNNYKENLPTFYTNISVGYQMQSNYLRALSYQQKSLDLAKSTNNITNQAFTNLNMGLTYVSMGDTARSKNYIMQAIKLAKAEHIKNVELYAYSNLSNILTKPSEANEAYTYAMQAVKLGREMGDVGITAASLAKAAAAKAKMSNVKEAMTLAEQAIAVADSSKQTFNIFQAYANMGSILKDQAKYEDAIPFLQKSIGILDKTDVYSEMVGSAYRDLSYCLEKTNAFSEALSCYKIAAEIADSMHRRDNIRKATELSMNYEFNKKEEAQQIVQQSKDAITRTRQTGLISVIVLTTILAIVALAAYRNKQKANASLQQQKEELQQALSKLKQTQTQLIQSEKMASLGELTAGIAHEIQNPLNFVNNFSEVSVELTEELNEELKNNQNDEATAIASDLKDNLRKINHHGKRADAIVKGMLQHSRKGTGERQLTNVNTLVEDFLKLSYHGFRAKHKHFETELIKELEPKLPEVYLVKEDIGRVLLNLFSNAFYAVSKKKAATDTSYQPTITVRTATVNGQVIIQVQDNGTGIPQNILDKILQPFFTTKPTGEGTGLGLSISHDIVVKGHNGKIEIESKEGSFTMFTVFLPLA